MATGGVVVFSLYSKYFDTQTDDCATSQSWVWPFPLPIIGSLTSNPLTRSLRAQLNTLVDNANAVILKAIGTAQANARTMTLVSANWDPWVQSTGGTFCRPGSSPFPNDASNNNVLFFKLATPFIWTPGIGFPFWKRDGISDGIFNESASYNYDVANMTVDELVDLAQTEYLKIKGRGFLTPEETKIFEYARYMELEARVNGPACSKGFISNLIP